MYNKKALNLDFLFGIEKAGCFATVDIDYPSYLHDLHSDFPLFPEKREVTADMMSESQKEIYNHVYQTN